MASMAAAIAASRSAALNGNRPLDERERKRFSYFSSLSPMARKIMAEKERIRQRYGPDWERLPPRQQDDIIDRSLVQPHVQARYAAHRPAARAPPPPACYPCLRLDTGQKLVRFGDEDSVQNSRQVEEGTSVTEPITSQETCKELEISPCILREGLERTKAKRDKDITWQDEHSAPFSWETKSQMEFSIASLSIQEPGGVALQNEQKQPTKTAPGPPAPKPSQSVKMPSADGLISARKEEESSFWKISAERSKCEGEQSEFYSLTPSQIKSMEKGEKTLQPYYRQESGPKEAPKVEKPKPEKLVTPVLATTSIQWEKSQPGQPSASSLDVPPEPVEKLSTGAKKEDGDGSFLSDLQTFGQNNTSNVILKTGFDFLDNW